MDIEEIGVYNIAPSTHAEHPAFANLAQMLIASINNNFAIDEKALKDAIAQVPDRILHDGKISFGYIPSERLRDRLGDEMQEVSDTLDCFVGSIVQIKADYDPQEQLKRMEHEIIHGGRVFEGEKVIAYTGFYSPQAPKLEQILSSLVIDSWRRIGTPEERTQEIIDAERSAAAQPAQASSDIPPDIQKALDQYTRGEVPQRRNEDSAKPSPGSVPDARPKSDRHDPPPR